MCWYYCFTNGPLFTQGLKELWMRAGIADTTRYLPVHTLATNIGPLCSVLPAL